MKLDVSSLAHMKWECKYHIVFAPKYRSVFVKKKVKQKGSKKVSAFSTYKR